MSTDAQWSLILACLSEYRNTLGVTPSLRLHGGWHQNWQWTTQHRLRKNKFVSPMYGPHVFSPSRHSDMYSFGSIMNYVCSMTIVMSSVV